MRLSEIKNIAVLAFKAHKCMPLSIQVSRPVATKGKPQLASPFAIKSLTLWGAEFFSHETTFTPIQVKSDDLNRHPLGINLDGMSPVFSPANMTLHRAHSVSQARC